MHIICFKSYVYEDNKNLQIIPNILNLFVGTTAKYKKKYLQ